MDRLPRSPNTSSQSRNWRNCYQWLGILVLSFPSGLLPGRLSAEEPRPVPDVQQQLRIERLIGQLGDGTFAQREAAGRELIEIGTPAIEALGRAENSKDLEVVKRSKVCLERIKHRAFVASLVAGLTNPDKSIQEKSARQLWDLGPKARQAIPDLINLLDHPDDAIRIRVVLALHYIGPEASRALPKFIEMMQDTRTSDQLLQRVIILCRGIASSEDDVTPILQKLLKSDRLESRRSAVSALGSLKQNGEEVIPDLLSAMRDPDEHVQRLAISSLGHLQKKPEVVVPILARRISDCATDPLKSQQKGDAIRAVCFFGQKGKVAWPLLLRILSDQREDKTSRMYIILMFRDQSPEEAKEAIPILEQVKQHSEVDLRRLAEYALDRLQR